MTNEPEYLYRYRHLENKHREYTQRILTDSVLYFASPSSFNDPFDCKVHFQPTSLSELRKRYEQSMHRLRPDLARAGRRTKARDDFRQRDLKEVMKKTTGKTQDSVNKLGVLSLSATDKNILLWSHYAAGHTGLCLRFSGISNSSFFGRAQQVKYSVGYPKVSVGVGPFNSTDVEALLFTKAKAWDYEQEWRIIDNKKGFGEKRFPPELLTGVILGARMSQEDRDEVLRWIEKRNRPVEICEAVVSSNSFSLNIVPYER